MASCKSGIGCSDGASAVRIAWMRGLREGTRIINNVASTGMRAIRRMISEEDKHFQRTAAMPWTWTPRAATGTDLCRKRRLSDIWSLADKQNQTLVALLSENRSLMTRNARRFNDMDPGKGARAIQYRILKDGDNAESSYSYINLF